MKKLFLIAAVLTLSGCETTSQYVNCDTARTAYTAAQTALATAGQALAYACPLPPTPLLPPVAETP
jgi:uncharacterized lipoprotein YajG